MRTNVLLGLTIGGAIAIGVVGTLLGGEPKLPDWDPRTSTLVSGPEGSQALHEALAELGVPVQRRRTALFNLSERAERVAVLAVLAPRDNLFTDELAEVVRYIAAGGAVVAAGEGGGITACGGYEAPRADSGWVTDGSFPDMGKPVPVRAPVSAPGLPPAHRVLEPWRVEERFERPSIRRRSEAGCGLLVPRSTDTLLTLRDGRLVAVALTFERGGRLVLVADPGYFRNRSWRDTDAPYFLIPLLTPPPERRGPLVWDEYHQGFDNVTRGPTSILWEWLWRSPTGWAILQLAAVVLVWLAVTAVRFGPARSVIERRRRSPLEHADALAVGLEGATGGADTAVDLIISGLRRRLSRTGHIGSADVAGWLAALQLALPTARGRAAARRLQHLRKERGGAERVLAAAQAVEDVWQDLRPASIPAPS